MFETHPEALVERGKRLPLAERIRLRRQIGVDLGAEVSGFKGLLDALPAAVYTTDAIGRIVYYNQAAAELWGCRPEVGKSEWCGSWRLYWPDGRPMPHDAPWPSR